MPTSENNVTKVIKRLNPFSRPKQKELPYNIYSEVEFRNALKLERGRANRDNHQFSVIVFEMTETEGDQMPIVKLVDKIADRVRRIDLIGWYDSQRIGVVLPYTSDLGAKKIVNDICYSLGDSMSLPGCAVYTYPSEKEATIESETKITLRKL